MASDEDGPYEDKTTSAPMGMIEAVPPPRRLTPARRRELMEFAANLAEQVEQQTKRYERCLLRRLVECLLGD